MKLTDEEKYKIGYDQGYYDAIASISEEIQRKKGWALMSLTDLLTDTVGREESDEHNNQRD